MELVALSAEHSVPILHTKSCARECVVLRNRHVDDLVDIEERIEYLPLSQDFSLEVDVFEPRGLGQDDFRTGALRSLSDAGPLKTAARLVAANISYDDPFRFCTQALADNLGYNIRIRVRCLFWSSIPPDVWLHEDNVTATYEPAHPSQFFDALAC